MDYRQEYEKRRKGIKECLEYIKSGDVIVFAGDGNAALDIANEFHSIAPGVEDVKIFKDCNSYFPFVAMDGMKGHIFSQGFFFGRDMRDGHKKGNCAFFPADIYMNGRFIADNNPNVFISAATPMDENGNLQVGLCNMWEPDSIDYVRKNHGAFILEVNPNLPRVNGGVEINITEVTALVESSRPISLIPPMGASEDTLEVARNVRSLIKDGDCVQFGIGGLPNAIAEMCMDLNDLGMHSEMVTSAMGKMVREGVITGKRKTLMKGKHVFTFAGGDQELFDTLKTNDSFVIVPANFGCDPFVIAQNDNMVSVNTCVEMDLMGQITSEAIGTVQFSGSGGAFCYAYGALRSKGGRGIMAFTSRSGKGFSKIKSVLSEGSTVTIPRNYADYIVTEYGIAQLRGKNLKERAEALIAIAHPDFRAELRKEAEKYKWL